MLTETPATPTTQLGVPEESGAAVPKTLTVGITGSRSLTDEDSVFGALERACRRVYPYPPNGYRIVHGGAEGVDRIAVDFFVRFPHDITVIRPEWDRYGKSAPFVRNQRIVDSSDVLIAVWDGLSKGTQHTIACAARKGIPVYVEVLTHA